MGAVEGGRHQKWVELGHGSKRAVRSLNQTRNYAGCEKALFINSSLIRVCHHRAKARDLQFAANCRSLASLEMTIYERYRPRMAPNPIFHHVLLQPAKELPHPLQRLVKILHRRRIREANMLGRSEAFSSHGRERAPGATARVEVAPDFIPLCRKNAGCCTGRTSRPWLEKASERPSMFASRMRRRWRILTRRWSGCGSSLRGCRSTW